jgi:ribosomal protein S7
MLKEFYFRTKNINNVNETFFQNKLLERKSSSLPSFVKFQLRQKVKEFDLMAIGKEKFLKLSFFNLIAKRLIKSGKSQRARTILNNVLSELKKKGFNKPLKLIYENLIFLKPIFNILTIKRGRKMIPMPFFLSEKTEIGVVIKSIVSTASNRSEKGIGSKLVAELIDIYQQKGLLAKKKINLISQVKDNAKNLRFLRNRPRRRKFFSLPKS